MRHDTGWLKSSHSAAASNDCVEVRLTDSHTDVRDSKNPTGPRLSLPGKTWTAFVAGLKR
ncbi:hypothetical protein FHS29_002099 [Saccharothrix tamanrassetensis]|uniref:DUF397 domain-containing protein n=1 Tax=Saccharothrix tamanrassetensis TaxID=1051531 RepID=A0A841CH71_9PSEU|nr:DUF397 domain-containing protein [Saccharothrix tamanrassetensis]MBB5955518.1 hypothetical protein [Saccharothrix tamanrassetensis]